jgi:hypothetical protein
VITLHREDPEILAGFRVERGKENRASILRPGADTLEGQIIE